MDEPRARTILLLRIDSKMQSWIYVLKQILGDGVILRLPPIRFALIPTPWGSSIEFEQSVSGAKHI